jgi:hypothetical protein
VSDVTDILQDDDFRAGHVFGEPFTVSLGGEDITFAVDNPGRNSDLGDVETPGRQKGKVIVHQPPHTVPECLVDGLAGTS